MALGTITFQANDKMDIFQVAQVQQHGIEPSDEALLNVEDPQFDSDKAWVTGDVPKMRSVNIEGDSTVINAWFKAEAFDKSFLVRVYVECELAEELDEVNADEKTEEEKNSSADLEPQEIYL